MLLLDEPLSALDRLTRDRLRRELKRIHGEIGVSILHITHDLSEAFFLADRLIIMKDGAVIQEGTPEDTLKCPRNRFVAELLGIGNFIPAEIGPGGLVFLEELGISASPVFSSESAEKGKKIYLTIPDWAIDLFPSKDNGAYLSQVNMRVAGLHHTEAYMEIELEHAHGARLSTTLSWREVSLLPMPIESGKIIKIGLLKEGTYWIPDE
jgi:ABC-type Fe3+/spermidine/putrescine transport system ATPase subunit